MSIISLSVLNAQSSIGLIGRRERRCNNFIISRIIIILLYLSSV